MRKLKQRAVRVISARELVTGELGLKPSQTLQLQIHISVLPLKVSHTNYNIIYSMCILHIYISIYIYIYQLKVKINIIKQITQNLKYYEPRVQCVWVALSGRQAEGFKFTTITY